MATQLISALILSVHLIAPSVPWFTVEVLDAGMLAQVVQVERTGPVYRFRDGERDGEVLFEAERSGLYGQFFLVFEAGNAEPTIVDLSEAFNHLVTLPASIERAEVMEMRLRHSRGLLYVEIPEIATTLVIDSDRPSQGWIVDPPREPWAR